jgi:hypothetical protein
MTDEEFEKEFVRDFDRQRGQICGLLESFNLGERHERAVIATFKSFSYDRQAALWERIQAFLAE